MPIHLHSLHRQQPIALGVRDSVNHARHAVLSFQIRIHLHLISQSSPHRTKSEQDDCNKQRTVCSKERFELNLWRIYTLLVNSLTLCTGCICITVFENVVFGKAVNHRVFYGNNNNYKHIDNATLFRFFQLHFIIICWLSKYYKFIFFKTPW